MTAADLTLTQSAPFDGLPAPHAADRDPALADHLPPEVVEALDGPLFAVLDASRVPFLPDRLEHEGLEGRMIYRSRAREDRDGDDPLAQVSPWLVRVDPESQLLADMFGADPEQPRHLMHRRAGILIAASVSFTVLLQHLRALAMPRDERGAATFFRFQEPGMLMGALVGLPTGAAAAVMDGIDRVIWPEETVEAGRWIVHVMAPAKDLHAAPRAMPVFDAAVREALALVLNRRRARAILREETGMPVPEREAKVAPLAKLLGQSQSSPAAMLHHLRLLDAAPPEERGLWRAKVASGDVSLAFVNRDMHARYGTGDFVR